MYDDEAGAVLATILEAHPGIELRLDAYQAFSLCAAIQLAARHPHVQASTLQPTLHAVVDQISASLGEPLATIISAGWRPDFDVPAEFPLATDRLEILCVDCTAGRCGVAKMVLPGDMCTCECHR